MLSTLLAFAYIVICVNAQLVPQNILLAGQDNLAGQGGVVKNKWDGIVPPESAPILMFKSSIQGYNCIDTKAVNGIGPGIPFANSLFQLNPRLGVIGLVPSGISGTKIVDWQKGYEAFNQLVKRAQAAGKSGGAIDVLVWYQGASDTVAKADTDAYKGRFQQFISDLQADLNLPNPVILKVPLVSGEGNFTEEVRQAQLNNGVPNTRVVDAKGLPLQNDKLYLTRSAHVVLGKKLADAFR